MILIFCFYVIVLLHGLIFVNMINTFVNIHPNKSTICFLRYLDVHVGTPDVEESFNVSRPVSPHEVIIIFYMRLQLGQFRVTQTVQLYLFILSSGVTRNMK